MEDGVLRKCTTKIGLSNVIPDEYKWGKRYTSMGGKCYLLHFILEGDVV